MEPHIGIAKKDREKVASLLNELLSDEYLLYTKTLNYHWNVRDSYFHAMHAFFKELYEKQFDFSDDVAERVRQLGGSSCGSMAEFLEISRLKETAGLKKISTKVMLKNLLDDHETIIRQIRIDAEKCTTLHDSGTNNFLIDLMEKHEKIAWMIRSSLE